VFISLLLIVGALAALSAFSLLGHQGDIPNWGIFIAVLLGVYFLCWTWALMLYLRVRERRTLVTGIITMDREELKGTVYGLIPGR